MNTFRIRVSWWWLPGMAMLALGCSAKPGETGAGSSAGNSVTMPAGNEKGSDSQSVDRVALLLNWYPEAEHGGFYAAAVHGIFKKHGLEVDIRPGGKTTVVPQELTIGRVQFGVGNADDVLMAREQTAPLVALMAPMQNGPRCIMVREDSGITSFEELKDITLQIDPARPYIPFMRSQGLLRENVKTVPYSGTVAQLVSDPRTAQQAYCFSEPLMAEEQGVKVRNLMMADIGYNPYASLLISSEEYIDKNPSIVRRMVAASIEGWKRYLEDPAETNRHILEQNRLGMTAEALAYGVKHLQPLCLPEGFPPEKLGEMEMERWQTLTRQLQELKMISERVTAEAAFTPRFLPWNEAAMLQ